MNKRDSSKMEETDFMERQSLLLCPVDILLDSISIDLHLNYDVANLIFPYYNLRSQSLRYYENFN